MFLTTSTVLVLFRGIVNDNLQALECLPFVNSTVCLYSRPPTLNLANVLMLEQDVRFQATQGCQRQAPWPLARISNIKPQGVQGDFAYEGRGGRNADVYVLDGWVDCAHRDFEGRCREVARFAEHSQNKAPVHGTHVAGLVGGKMYGAAKQAQIKSVVVLDDEGFGEYSSFVKALEFVKRTRNPKRNIIVNMSLKGPRSNIVDRVVEELHQGGIAIVVVAAGNDNDDACAYSPNSKKIPIVGASTFNNDMTSFSNYGSCVSIIAPGEGIPSLCPGNNYCGMSGTSQAAPLTAGAIAVFWDPRTELKSQQLWTAFLRHSTRRNALRSVKGQTANRFIMLDSDDCRRLKCGQEFLYDEEVLLVQDT